MTQPTKRATGLRGYNLWVAVMATITTHPEHHRQDAWKCGSGCCAAGWCTLLAGDRFIPALDPLEDWVITAESLDTLAEPVTAYRAGYEGTHSIASRANDLLGTLIDYDENDDAIDLFDASHTLETLYEAGAVAFGVTETQLRFDVDYLLSVATPADLFVERMDEAGQPITSPEEA